MDFIRYEKSRPDYDHNTKHCLYGLDADLVSFPLSFTMITLRKAFLCFMLELLLLLLEYLGLYT